MNVTFYLPNEGADYPYLSTRLEQPPAMGSTIRVQKSDNPTIPPGTFKVVAIVYDVDIVNQRMAAVSGRGIIRVDLERVP